MKTKTFKIGEYSMHGIITAEIKKDIITIKLRQWDTSTGYNKKSDQSNAKVIESHNFSINDWRLEQNLFMYLTNDTTPYYADQIISWIKSKIK